MQRDPIRGRCIFSCSTPCLEGCEPGPHFWPGTTPSFALEVDQRFSYCLYIPNSYEPDGALEYPVLVAMHGTERRHEWYRDAFADLADQVGCVVLAPLFPCGIGEPGELHNYKFIEFGGIRYDQILLSMLDQVASTHRVRTDRFLLFGFSGGAQYAHRFLYLHPRRLAGVSIAAPGWVTLLDPERRWWVGVHDIGQRFGIDLDLAGIRDVPVHLVVGGDDTDTWDVTIPLGSRRWTEGANDPGVTRIDRVSALRKSLVSAGVNVCFDVVAGVGHEPSPLVASAQQFFRHVLDDSKDDKRTEGTLGGRTRYRSTLGPRDSAPSLPTLIDPLPPVDEPGRHS